MVMALTLEVVMLTLAEVWLLAAAVKLTGFEEALRVPLPPPPPPEPLKLTVIVTGPGTAPGGTVAVGVRVTVADDPWLNPDAVRTLKFRLDGVVVPPDTISHPVGAPVVSPE